MADQSIGALWQKEKMMSGNILIAGQKINIVVFKNDYKKEGDRTPDFKIYLSREREAGKTPEQSPNEISDIEPF